MLFPALVMILRGLINHARPRVLPPGFVEHHRVAGGLAKDDGEDGEEGFDRSLSPVRPGGATARPVPPEMGISPVGQIAACGERGSNSCEGYRSL